MKTYTHGGYSEPAKKAYYTMQEVCDMLGVKKYKAYELIREANEYAEAHGKITFRGRIDKKLFAEIFLWTDDDPVPGRPKKKNS